MFYFYFCQNNKSLVQVFHVIKPLIHSDPHHHVFTHSHDDPPDSTEICLLVLEIAFRYDNHKKLTTNHKELHSVSVKSFLFVSSQVMTLFYVRVTSSLFAWNDSILCSHLNILDVQSFTCCSRSDIIALDK